MGKIEILNVGYIFIDKNSNENIELVPNIISDPEKFRDCSEKKFTEVFVNLNKYQISDFHIVLVKNLDGIKLSCLLALFNKVGNYSGTIAIGIDYKGFNLIYHYFLDDYLKLIYDNNSGLPIYSQGSRIDFILTNPLGRMFSKYSSALRYGCAMKPSDKLRNTIAMETALDILINETANSTPKNEKFAHEDYIEFAKNPGGETVGVMLRISKTTVILHPIITDSNKEAEFSRDLLDIIEEYLLGVKKNKDIPPVWVNETLPEYKNKEMNALNTLNSILIDENMLRNLYWTTGEDLEGSVEFAFKKLGFEVENIAELRDSRDLIIKYKGMEWYVGVKGREGIIDLEDVSKFITNNLKRKLIFVANHYRRNPPETRGEAYTTKAKETIKESLKEVSIESFYPITSLDLIDFIKKGYVAEDTIKAMEAIARKYL